MNPDAGEPAGEAVSTSPYDRVAIGLHWVSALIVVTLWLIAQFVGLLPRGPLRLGMWSTHVLVGFMLAIIIAVRVFWRVRHPPREPQERDWLNALARPVHVGLYGLIVTAIGFGLANAFLRGYDMFGIWTLPKLPGDRGLVSTINDWHALAANALIAFAVLHATAALFHHFVLRDGVLRRMIPGLRPQQRRSRST